MALGWPLIAVHETAQSGMERCSQASLIHQHAVCSSQLPGELSVLFFCAGSCLAQAGLELPTELQVT